jgi:hypothetical protein
MSARSNGSVRRLKSFGTRSSTNGSAQICSVPWTRCSMKTTFQLSKRSAEHVAVVGEVDQPWRGDCPPRRSDSA